MESWLERLQKKPRIIRQQIAFGGAVLLTSLVVVVWGLSLPARISQITQPAAPVVPEETTSNLQNFMASIRSQMATVGEALRATSEIEIETNETPPVIEVPDPATIATPTPTTTDAGRRILIATTSSSVSVPGALPVVE